jgi:hypothetical protein
MEAIRTSKSSVFTGAIQLHILEVDILLVNMLRRPRRTWVYNIRMDIVEIGWGGVDWIGLA